MSVYHVTGSKVRHLEISCGALRAEVLALHPEIGEDVSKLDAACEMTRRANTEKLREHGANGAPTARCTAGCWREYAKDERASALTGDRAHGKDAEWNAASLALHASARDRAALKRALKKLDDAERAAVQQRAQDGSSRVKRASS